MKGGYHSSGESTIVNNALDRYRTRSYIRPCLHYYNAKAFSTFSVMRETLLS